MDRPDDVSQQDDEYDAYRKRMMLAYRFRPNPLVSYLFSIFFYFLIIKNIYLISIKEIVTYIKR